jgi:hypothetical protein
MTGVLSCDGVLDLPRSHRHHYEDPFLIVTCRLRDIGLVGWNDRRWSHQDKAPAKRNRKPRVQPQQLEQRRRQQHNTADRHAQGQQANVQTSWLQAFDPECNAYYFYNMSANLTVWDEPAEGFVPDATVQYYLEAGIAPAYVCNSGHSDGSALSQDTPEPAATTPGKVGSSVQHSDPESALDMPDVPASRNQGSAVHTPSSNAAEDTRSPAPSNAGHQVLLSDMSQRAVPTSSVTEAELDISKESAEADNAADAAPLAYDPVAQQPSAAPLPEPEPAEAPSTPPQARCGHMQSSGHGANDHNAPAHVRFSPSRKGELPEDVERYWLARYSLMSRWSEGVRLDKTSLHSITPEVIAKHQAAMLAPGGVVFDAFCGSGGNAIQLAMQADKVRTSDEQLLLAASCFV